MSHAPIAGPLLVGNDPAIRARINAAYPAPIYHVDEILPSHRIPHSYLAAFRAPGLQQALAETLGPGCVAQRVAQGLSSPFIDAREHRARAIPEGSLSLVHHAARGWEVIANRPIAAGDAIGNYWGELSDYQGPGAGRPGAQGISQRRFLDRILDSYPRADGLSPAARRALRARVRALMITQSPYGFLITLPSPDAPPLRLLIDSIKRGAITRFLSHSEAPNLSRVFCRDLREGLYSSGSRSSRRGTSPRASRSRFTTATTSRRCRPSTKRCGGRTS